MCEELALQYSKTLEVKTPPSEITAVTDRQNFLRSKSEWTCLTPSGTVLKSPEKKDCEAVQGTFTKQRLDRPVFNQYKEEGFLPWLNFHGMQCIHHVTGLFHGVHDTLDEKIYNPLTDKAEPITTADDLGTTKQPKHRPLPGQCSAACFAVTEKSTECFDCVAKAVVASYELKTKGATAVLCPNAVEFATMDAPAISTMLRKSVSCKSCIAQQALKVNGKGAKRLTGDDDPAVVQALKDHQTQDCWRCIEGYRPVQAFVQTTEFIVIMVCIAILILTASIVGIVVAVERAKMKMPATSSVVE